VSHNDVVLVQDGVNAAKRSLQMDIQTAVHKIYQQLSVTLERALQANKHHIGEHHIITKQGSSIQVLENNCVRRLSVQPCSKHSKSAQPVVLQDVVEDHRYRVTPLSLVCLSPSSPSLSPVPMRKDTFQLTPISWTTDSVSPAPLFSPHLSLVPEAQQRLLLVTVFALSVRYQSVDVSLAISSGLLNVLSQLCGTETLLGQPLQLLQKPGVSQLSTALKVASTRLLQILAISTG
jgi:hypothetical protein